MCLKCVYLLHNTSGSQCKVIFSFCQGHMDRIYYLFYRRVRAEGRRGKGAGGRRKRGLEKGKGRGLEVGGKEG